MGAFLIIKKDKKTTLNQIEESYKDSINIFKKKGLELSKKIERQEFVLYLYYKYCLKEESFYEFENDDFILSTGTAIFKEKMGKEALKELFEDFISGKNVFNDLNGHFSIVISHNSNLYCFNDYLGLYRVYYDKTHTVFSSSFLAITKALKQKSISKQELYEYIFQGAFYGYKTIFKEVELLSSSHIWQILSKVSKTKKSIEFDNLSDSKNFKELIGRVSNTQLEYFKMLKRVFGNKIASALSGGYDSRLMLALSKKANISLNLYVYGPESLEDVKIAKEITKSEGFKLDHINKDLYPKIDPEKYYENIKNNFYCFDALSRFGVFDNGSDIDTRIKRTSTSRIHLNGGGGEIYRNYWKLPYRSYSIKNFLKSKYHFVDFALCTDEFSKTEYFSNFEEKIKELLSIDGKRISKNEIVMLYPFLRFRFRMSINNSINNQFAYSLTPFAEPKFVFQSFNIPMKFKNDGFFQAFLIKVADFRISKYHSAYGMNFYDKIPIKNKIKGFMKRNVPVFMRPTLRKYMESREFRRPYFLQEEFLTNVFNIEELSMSKYIDVWEIKSEEMLSRALTLELLIRDEF